MGKFINKKPDHAALVTQAVAAQGPGALAVCPCLWEYLTLDRWEGGGKRQTASLSFFVDDGNLKLCINDRALQRSAFLAVDTLESGLLALEAKLVEDGLDWRGWKGKK